MSSPSPSPTLSGAASPPLPKAATESTVARLIIAPVTFVSFLISLALIDSHNSSLRSHYHVPSHRVPPSTRYGRLKQTLHGWVYREEPYAYVKSPDARAGSEEEVKKDEKSEPWHWNTKQKKMMKMEISDAFEIRTRVVVVLVGIVLGLTALAMWGVKIVLGALIWTA